MTTDEKNLDLKEIQMSLRIPQYLKTMVEEEAKKKNISQNTEIITRLRNSFSGTYEDYTDALNKIDRLIQARSENTYSKSLSVRLQSSLNNKNMVAEWLGLEKATVSTMAYSLGYAEGSVMADYFSGKGTPSFDSIKDMAKYLGVDPDYLMHGTAIPYPIKKVDDSCSYEELIKLFVQPYFCASEEPHEVHSVYVCESNDYEDLEKSNLSQLIIQGMMEDDIREDIVAILKSELHAPVIDTINPFDLEQDNRFGYSQRQTIIQFISSLVAAQELQDNEVGESAISVIEKAVAYLVDQVFITENGYLNNQKIYDFTMANSNPKLAIRISRILDEGVSNKNLTIEQLKDKLMSLNLSLIDEFNIATGEFGLEETEDSSVKQVEIVRIIEDLHKLSMPTLIDIMKVLSEDNLPGYFDEKVEFTGETVSQYIRRQLHTFKMNSPYLFGRTTISREKSNELFEKITDSFFSHKRDLNKTQSVLIIKNYMNAVTEAYSVNPKLFNTNITAKWIDDVKDAWGESYTDSKMPIYEISKVDYYRIQRGYQPACLASQLPSPLLEENER